MQKVAIQDCSLTLPHFLRYHQNIPVQNDDGNKLVLINKTSSYGILRLLLRHCRCYEYCIGTFWMIQEWHTVGRTFPRLLDCLLQTSESPCRKKISILFTCDGTVSLGDTDYGSEYLLGSWLHQNFITIKENPKIESFVFGIFCYDGQERSSLFDSKQLKDSHELHDQLLQWQKRIFDSDTETDCTQWKAEMCKMQHVLDNK